jgi:colicin import membrane protein
MKKIALALLISLASLPLWAQSNAASGAADLAAERSRLSAERAVIEQRFLREKRDQSVQNQTDREQRSADHATSRAATAAESAERERQFESKKQANANEQAKAAQRQAEAPAAVSRHEDKQRRAAEHRASRERQNTDRSKPRGAPLPPAASSPAP